MQGRNGVDEQVDLGPDTVEEEEERRRVGFGLQVSRGQVRLG